MEAIYDFLKVDNDFVIDKEFNKLGISTSRDGYLKRIKQPLHDGLNVKRDE
jgi:cephalosporin hydroxylase